MRYFVTWFIGGIIGALLLLIAIRNIDSCGNAIKTAEYYLPCLQSPNCKFDPYDSFKFERARKRLKACKKEME